MSTLLSLESIVCSACSSACFFAQNVCVARLKSHLVILRDNFVALPQRHQDGCETVLYGSNPSVA